MKQESIRIRHLIKHYKCLNQSIHPLPPRLPLHKVNEGSVRKQAEPLSREDRLRIIALNPLDLELYRHAVMVHKERIVEVMRPCRIRTNCTSVRDRDLNLIWGEGALRSCGRMVYRSGRAGCRA